MLTPAIRATGASPRIRAWARERGIGSLAERGIIRISGPASIGAASNSAQIVAGSRCDERLDLAADRVHLAHAVDRLQNALGAVIGEDRRGLLTIDRKALLHRF